MFSPSHLEYAQSGRDVAEREGGQRVNDSVE